MRIRIGSVAFVAMMLLVASCSDGGRDPVSSLMPQLAGNGTMPTVRLSEIHYDNVGTDIDERIEVSGPSGMDVTGWTIVLYNGNGGVTYGVTQTLNGAFPATCDPRGVMVFAYASNGIQNGGTSATATTDADGIALVDNTGAVVEFISYEGAFLATNGPAIGMTSTDIGVRELGEPVGQSLQRTGNNTWNAPAAHTFGACNDDVTTPVNVATVTVAPATATITAGQTQTFTAEGRDASNQVVPTTFTWTSSDPAIASVDAAGVATGHQAGDVTITATAPNNVTGTAQLHVDAAPPPGVPSVRFSEFHYDNAGVDAGEAIEVEGPASVSVTGWTIVLYNGNGGVTYGLTHTLNGAFTDQCNGRGTLHVTYPQDGLQNGSPDGFALVDDNGVVVEFLSYEGSFAATNGPAAGMTSTDIGASETSTSPIGQSLQRSNDGTTWSGPAAATFGACNGSTPPPPTNTITFSGRLASDPALPVGFQDQIFATVRDGNGQPVVSAITWASETPTIASIDQNGVITGLTAGAAIFRATAEDGTTTNTHSLPIRVATAGNTAQYGNNGEFGEPADADASDDFVLRHPYFTSSFNQNRGTPNWVAYNLDATHFGPEDRCDCFTYDPALPASFTRYTTADYTGAGAFHGFGIDRGHLARSFDRTTGSLDNAFTFYFSNIIPQAADNNQGPWAAFENHLGDLARFQDKEVYVIAGASGSQGTVKNEGKIVIPASTWKVAVVMSRDQGLANVTGVQDLQIIAVIMPNQAGIRNVNWETYKTTVDAVEALSGYDLLALLADQIEIAVESGTSPPVAATDGPYSSVEGSSIAMDGSASSDPDLHQLSYAWDFGDGTTGSGFSVSHTYAQDGLYTVTLTVTDILGLTNTTTTSANVANVAPSIGTFAGATLLPGETYTASGSFTDPGADQWSGTVDYDDGGGVTTLGLNGQSFSLSHTYAAAGTFTVAVGISDDDVTSTRTQTVTVLTAIQGVTNAEALVNQLIADGSLTPIAGAAFIAQLRAASDALARGQPQVAATQLSIVIREIDQLVRLGRLSASDAAPLRTLLVRILNSITN